MWRLTKKCSPRHLRASADRGLLCLSVRALCGSIYVSVASSVSVSVTGSSRRTPVRFRTDAQPPGPRPSRSLSLRHHGLSFGPPVHPHEQPDAVLSIHFIMSHAMCLVRHVPCLLCLARRLGAYKFVHAPVERHRSSSRRTLVFGSLRLTQIRLRLRRELRTGAGPLSPPADSSTLFGTVVFCGRRLRS